MKTIIQQILSKAAEKYINYFEENGITEISRMAEDFKCISEEMAKELLVAFIDSADEAIREAKAERKADEIKVQEKKVPRTLLTDLGSFTYKRTYYNLPGGGRKYLLDDILKVDAYERIDTGISAKLVNTAARYSYGRSADIVTGGMISRQSVKNKVMNTGEVLYIPEKADKTPEMLHIFADEDHIHLQNGRNAIIPLITVCEGKKNVCKGRNELIEAFHTHGYGMGPGALWEYVYALCSEKYDMSRIKKVYIYGDGAPWILNGLDVFAGAVHILDEFHFKKRLKKLLAGEICSPYSAVIHAAISNNNKARFSRIVDKVLVAAAGRQSA
jgi:hypothetical protein